MIAYEKLLKKFLKAVEMLPEEERAAFRHFSKAGSLRGKPLVAGQCLAEIADDLRAAIAEQTEKAAGRGSAQRAMLRLVKRAPRENVRCAWMQDGNQCACDGVIAVEVFAPLAGIPEADPGVVPLDVSRIIEPARYNSGLPVPVPSLAELKSHIKIYRAEHRFKKGTSVPLDLGEDLPLLDAVLLADIREIVPDAKFTASGYNPQTRMVYFEGSAGRGVICPIRRSHGRVA